MLKSDHAVYFWITLFFITLVASAMFPVVQTVQQNVLLSKIRVDIQTKSSSFMGTLA